MVFCTVCLSPLGASEWQEWRLGDEDVPVTAIICTGYVRDHLAQVWSILCPRCVVAQRETELAELRTELRREIDSAMLSLTMLDAIVRRLFNFTRRTGLMRDA